MAFFGAIDFFAAVGPCRVMTLEKKRVSTQKTSKISKTLSPRASDTGKGPHKHNAPDLWDRGSVETEVLVVSIMTDAGPTQLQLTPMLPCAREECYVRGRSSECAASGCQKSESCSGPLRVQCGEGEIARVKSGSMLCSDVRPFG